MYFMVHDLIRRHDLKQHKHGINADQVRENPGFEDCDMVVD